MAIDAIKPIAGAALSATLFSFGNAQAHYLWIERTDSGARIYYGEPDVLLKEESPGKLDNIKSPQAFVIPAPGGQSQAVALRRAANSFVVSGDKTAPAIMVADESAEVRDLSKHGLGFAKSNYYARHGQLEAGAHEAISPLALDFRSRGQNTLAVFYRGRPLKNAKLEVIAPNTWMQEHKTNEHGVVEINTPWRGQYVVHMLHVDTAPGEFAGRKYESLRNHFTYTFIRQDGADPGPAIAPKHSSD